MEKRLIKYIALVLCLLILASCSENTAPPQAPSVSQAVVSKSVNPPIPQEVEQEIIQKYVYNALGKRDPFENPLQAIVEVASDTGVPLTPLQKFDLGQLRLIGVIVGRGEPRAMVIAPDGKSFILNIGTKVGKNDGSVVKITTDAVSVKEKYYDFSGEVKTSTQEIMLPKQGGVK